MERGTLIDWNLHFYYDGTSPTCLRWNKDIYSGCRSNIKQISKGDIAGCFISNPNNTPKSIDVRLNNKLYKVHRIIYEILNGEIINNFVIDHLDQNPWNNKISNLKAKNKSENHRNTKLFTSNTSGTIGVYWQTMNSKKHTYAVGSVQFNSKPYSKRFGVHHHGLLESFHLAAKWREDMIDHLNREFEAGFTKNHGTASNTHTLDSGIEES